MDRVLSHVTVLLQADLTFSDNLSCPRFNLS